MAPHHRPRYAASPIRCQGCDSSATMRTSQYLGVQTYVCLDCDEVWTTSTGRGSLNRRKTTEPRVAASARDIVAAMQKTPPPSIEEIRLMLTKGRKQTTMRTMVTKRHDR